MPTPDELKTAYAATVEPEPKRGLLEALKGRVGPKPVQEMQAPALARKLEAAQSELRTLEAQVGPLSFEAAQVGSEPTKVLIDLKVQILGAKDRVAMLSAAHKIAQQKDDEVLRASRIGLRKAQIAAMRKNLDARDASAKDLSDCIAEAIKHWKIIVERSKKAGEIMPVGDTLPAGAISELAELKKLVAQEIYRLDGGDAMDGNLRSFPGAVCLNIDYMGQPGKIEPLVDHLKRNSEFVVATVTGKAPGA